MTKSEKIRRQWLAMLSVLVAPMADVKATESLVKMLPMFASLPDEVFCQRTLELVASTQKRVPNYAELREILGDWWKEHRPPPAPVPVFLLKHDNQVAREAANARSWDDAEGVRARVRTVLSSPAMQRPLGLALAAAVARNAPHHLGLIPPEWLPEAQP